MFPDSPAPYNLYMDKIFGYARCSTTKEKQDITRQMNELDAAGAEIIFKDFGSGADTNRKNFNTLQTQITSGDTLTATELSRVTRSIHHLCHIIEWAAEKKIILKFGGFTADFTVGIDPMVEGMIYMMGVFAQMERGITTQRINSGIANARTSGKKLGRPSMSKADLPEIFIKNLPRYEAGQITVSEFARSCETSRATIHRYLVIARQR